MMSTEQLDHLGRLRLAIDSERFQTVAQFLLHQPLLTAFGIVVLYLVLQTTYQAFFSPLQKVPGPFLARFSGLWMRLHNFYGRRSHKIHEAHTQYGPMVRIGPKYISVSSPAIVRDLYTSKKFVKEQQFYRAKRQYSEDNLFTFIDPERHAQRRKLLSRGFAQGAMLDFEPRVADKVNALCQQWAKSPRSHLPVDVYPWAHMFAFDVVYHLMFDVDPQTIKNGKDHEVMPYLNSWRPLYIYKEFIPQLEKLGIYLPGSMGAKFRDVRRWKAYSIDIVRNCRANGTKTPFLTRVLDGDDGFLGRPLNDSELTEECMSAMFGGSGSVANSFTYIIWGTLRNPEVYDKLKKELKLAYPDRTSQPDYLTCSKLPYLQAVIKETLRRYPTTIAQLPRVATEDVVLGGMHIPKGTTVGAQNYTTHRDSTAFPEPEKFIPERWLSGNDENLNKAFTPFSIGTRKCIGLNLAEMELTLLAASFFRRFQASIDPQMKEADMEMYDTFNAGPVGSKLVLRLKEEET